MKTPKEFDYDLWTTEENGIKHYWTRVKATGEVTEVSHDVMKCLRNFEKQMRRTTEEDANESILSLEESQNETNEQWLADPYELESDVITRIMEDEFVKSLTEKQKRFYYGCMKSNRSLRDYAKENNIGTTTAQTLQKAIRKKAKKFFY